MGDTFAKTHDDRNLTRRSFLTTAAAATAVTVLPAGAAQSAGTWGKGGGEPHPMPQAEPPVPTGPVESGQAPESAPPSPPPSAPETPKGELLPKLRLQPLNATTERESPFAPTAAPPEKRLGYAIVGLGRLALEQILPAFGQAKRSRPVALVSGHREKALHVARQYGIKPESVYGYADFDRIRENPEIDIVYIVLPNALHAEYTVRAAKAGKHVLTEKPMATSAKECETMIAACREANRKLMVAYRIQYEPNHRAVRKMIQTGDLGAVKVIEAHNIQNQGGDLSQWRLNKALAGGGALPDIGLYCLNTMRFLTGEEPTELFANVYSTPGDPRFQSVEETVIWQMRFPSGVMAACTTSYGGHNCKRYRVYGARGWVDMDPAFQYSGLQMKVGRLSPDEPEAESVEKRSREAKNQFALEMDHFSQCVAENKTPWTPGEEGLQDQRLMEAIYQSARESKVIKIAAAPKARDAFRGSMPEGD